MVLRIGLGRKESVATTCCELVEASLAFLHPRRSLYDSYT